MASSYSSLFFSNNEEEECLLRTPPIKFKGNIPFSWEQIPGIPKHLQQESKKKQQQQQQKFHHLLPPPPPVKLKSHESNFRSIRSSSSVLQRDPFIAALVQCSKDDRAEGSRRVSLSGRHRFGFTSMIYFTSCKRSTCAAVSESIVCFPRSAPH